MAHTASAVQKAAFIREPGEGPSHHVVGTTHIYKLLPEESVHNMALWEVILLPGAGVPPHAHESEDEAFYVLEGSLMMEMEGTALPRRLKAGSFAFSPRGVQHAFHNAGPGRTRLFVMATPAASLVQMFGEMDTAAHVAEGTPPLQAILEISARHGVAIAAPG